MTPEALSTALQAQILLPILRLEDPETCFQLAMALLRGGFSLIEITLTTPDALSLLARLRAEGATVGAGTVLTPAQARDALAAGAEYLISPGLSPEIAAVATDAGMPYLPGVYTPTEVMQALALKLNLLKLFPASSGGIAHLKALAGPFPQARWLPTGGIELAEGAAWRRAGALAIGQGTRLVPAELLATRDWHRIEIELRRIRAEVAAW